MCLLSKKRCPTTSSKPRKVWKILIQTEDGIVITPFMRIKVALVAGETLKARAKKVKKDDYGIYAIDKQGVHAFSLKKAAIHFHKQLLKSYLPKTKPLLTEWVIPANTPYWLDYRLDEIAAQQMVFVKVVK